jgi:hypothetical protein
VLHGKETVEKKTTEEVDNSGVQPVYTVAMPPIIWEIQGTQPWNLEGYRMPGKPEDSCREEFRAGAVWQAPDDAV